MNRQRTANIQKLAAWVDKNRPKVEQTKRENNSPFYKKAKS